MPLGIGATSDFFTNQLDIRAVLDEAKALLNETYNEPVAQGWRALILELGGKL